MNTKLIYFILICFCSPIWGQIPQSLKSYSDEINQSLPEIYDPVTKLVRTTTQNNNFIYHFLLDANQKEYSWALPKVKNQILKTVCKDSRSGKVLRQFKANLIFNYENVKGQSLGEFMVRPEFCGTF